MTSDTGASRARTPVDAVRSFLRKSGYPLEMRVARAFQAEGFVVEQARQYIDPVTGDLRDLDVFATHKGMARLHPTTTLRELRLVIECKTSETPWILFMGDDRFSRGYEQFDTIDVIELAGGKIEPARSADDMPVIAYSGQLCYRVNNAGAKDAPTFDAIRQVTSATVGIRRDLVNEESYHGPPAVIALVPVLVTTAPLVECRLDSRGELLLSEVDKGVLFTRLRAEDRLHTLWIVNATAVDAFAQMARTTAENIQVRVPSA